MTGEQWGKEKLKNVEGKYGLYATIIILKKDIRGEVAAILNSALLRKRKAITKRG